MLVFSGKVWACKVIHGIEHRTRWAGRWSCDGRWKRKRSDLRPRRKGDREIMEAKAAFPITDPGKLVSKEVQIMVRCVCC